MLQDGNPAAPGFSVVRLVGRYSNPVHPEKTLEELEQLVRDVTVENDRNDAPQIQRILWKLSKTDEQRLVAANSGGATVSALSRQLDVSRGRGRTILVSHDARPCRGHPVSTDQLTQAIALYAQGLSIASIATQLGLTPTTLNNHLRKAGATHKSRQLLLGLRHKWPGRRVTKHGAE
ncbi:hypothetical protein [Arthrobacter sp. RAF14]|uniref:hypothetical protein n=1 Tax=Arthrobacter sp. RAF14 TaxID=3233051 RepID=UPI003F900B67